MITTKKKTSIRLSQLRLKLSTYQMQFLSVTSRAICFVPPYCFTIKKSANTKYFLEIYYSTEFKNLMNSSTSFPRISVSHGHHIYVASKGMVFMPASVKCLESSHRTLALTRVYILTTHIHNFWELVLPTGQKLTLGLWLPSLSNPESHVL
jgi:hypothetical protein